MTEWWPWFPEVGNSWTAVWWNLNVQVAYPVLNGDRPQDRDIVRRSFDHWAGLRGRWHGYSFAAASSMLSTMDGAEDSLAYLKFFIDGNVEDNTALTPNTMYREGSNFAIERPLPAAQSVLDMLVQSHDGMVRVFPAVRVHSEAGEPLGLRPGIDGELDVRDERGRPLP